MSDLTAKTPGGVTISTRGPGGVKVDWYTDEAGSRYSDGTRVKVVDAIDKESYPDILSGTNKSFGIHAVIPGINASDQKRLIAESEKGAQIIIRNNKATRGGAIAANSPIVLGESSDDILIKTTGDLVVNKKWNGKPSTTMVFVNLIRYDVDENGDAIKGGDRVVLDRDTVISQDGGWSTFYTDLPKEYTDAKGNKRFCKYTVEEQKSGAYKGRITKRDEKDDTVTIELTNTPTAKRLGAEYVPDEEGGSIEPKNKKTPSDKGDKNVGTSDPVNITVPFVLILVSLLSLIFIFLRRRSI